MSNYLIIEKDKEVINTIKRVLEDFPEFYCIGTSQNLNESMNTILKEMPDIVFFNIDTIKDNPFGFINNAISYLNKGSEFIAISSTKDKAYEAIKNGCFDYLLRPITELEIRKTALRFKKKRPTKVTKKICLKSYKDYQYLNLEDILFLKADNNTTDFHMIDGSTISAYKTLKTYETILPDNFLRIHKSYIVNRNHISRVSYSKLKCTIKKDSQKIPFSKTYNDNVEAMISTLSPSLAYQLN